ncbi:MAG: hypothetical protein U0804_16495 [Gemmataceae bacterium]
MKATSLGGATLTLTLGFGLTASPHAAGRADEPAAAPGLPTDTALAAVIRANGGRVPATGEQLWAVLRRVGPFAQLPVPFSAVRLDSGITAPRVVIAAHEAGLSKADVNAPNVEGRLFLAAQMQRSAAGGELRVAAVEFISWTPSRGRFDFGLIEGMGGAGEPRLEVVDGSRCFACHRNRGPILGVRPWSNTAHDDFLRFATAGSLRLSGTRLPQSGPFVLPWTRPGAPPAPDRVDGMALAIPEAAAVDAAVRAGGSLRSDRDTFRLLAKSPDGRKGLVLLLAAVAAPGPLDPPDAKVRAALDAALAPSFKEFAAELVELRKGVRPNALLDIPPSALLSASGVRPSAALTAGSGWAAPASIPAPAPAPVSQSPGALSALVQAAREQKATATFVNSLVQLGRYDAARSVGAHGMTSRILPSHPRAFVTPVVTRPGRASDVVSPGLLARTVGLSDGDRRFLARSLADAASRAGRPKVTAAVLAQGVFEGPHFASVLAGGPLPDRDEFKERFAAGLHELLTRGYGVADGFAPARKTYTAGPRYEPSDEPPAAIVPTSACLRCHEVGAGRPARFDPIPPLAFDPFDAAGREAWLRTADATRKRAVLTRLVGRLVTDADMPPEDAPEHDRFRRHDAAGFDAAVRLLVAELARVGGP